MRMFASLAGAGVVGFIALKLLGVLAAPLLGVFGFLVAFTVGVVGLILKIAFVMAVGWFVLRIFRGRKAATA